VTIPFFVTDEGQIYLTFVFVSNIAAIIDLENHSESGILTVVELHGRYSNYYPRRKGRTCL
jgi:hypothetical protein